MMALPARKPPAPPLLPPDAKAAASSSADLDRSVAQSRRATAAVRRLADDLDSDRISLDGVVLEPLAEEDTLVRHARLHLAPD